MTLISPGWHTGTIGMGGPGLYTKVPASPKCYAFYDDPTYGIVIYQDPTDLDPGGANHAYKARLYKIVADDRKPTGLRVDLVGDPVVLFAPYYSDPTVNRIDTFTPSVMLENHILFTETIFTGATTPGRGDKVTGFAIAALTRSGDTISLSTGHCPTPYATDGYFNWGNPQSMTRVGPDSVARGVGIAVGDGTVLATGAFNAQIDGITFAGGSPTIRSTTYFGSTTGHPFGPAPITGLALSGWFAKFENWDSSRGRLLGMRDNSGFFSTSRFVEGIEWDLDAGSTVSSATVTTSNKTPWDSGPLPQEFFKTIIIGTGDGLTQTLQGSQPMDIFSEGASDVTEAVATDGSVWSQFPFVSHSTLYDGTGVGYDGSMVVAPSFGNHLTFAVRHAAGGTEFTLQRALTNQSGLSLSLASQADTVITSANFPKWNSIGLVAGARHTSGICVIGFGGQTGTGSFPTFYVNEGYFLEALTV